MTPVRERHVWPPFETLAFGELLRVRGVYVATLTPALMVRSAPVGARLEP